MQGWILKNFKLIAVIESLDEPWFTDARVKTAVTILQRCTDEKSRMENVTKFVRLFKPVKEILGERPHGDEAARQTAVESLRQLILQTKTPYSNNQLRIMPVPQSELWNEGVRAGKLLKQPSLVEIEAEEDEEDDGSGFEAAVVSYEIGADYAAGKWGRFLRAPGLYFKLLSDYQSRFVRLGEIAEVRFGIKSGCDAFFMPRDVTNKILEKVKDGLAWNDVGLMTSCKRSEIESGKVCIVRAGDNTLHPIETEYLRPEVHSLMQVKRPVILASDLDRVVLWVDKPLTALAHTHVARYIRWGSKRTFASKNLKTEVVDTVLLEIPDPRGISQQLAERLSKALDSMTHRDVTHLVDEAMLQCHSEEAMREILRRPSELPIELCQKDRRELDDCVIELIGVSDKNQRQTLLDELYLETTEYYRYVRTQEIQAMENRSGKKGRRLGPQDLGESIWHSLSETEKGSPIVEWIKSFSSDTEVIEIPEGKPEALGAADMFNPTSVNFKGNKENRQITYSSADQAVLASELASMEVRGKVEVPKSPTECTTCSNQLRRHLRDAENRFAELAASRTGTQSLQEKTASLLLQWYVHGKS